MTKNRAIGHLIYIDGTQVMSVIEKKRWILIISSNIADAERNRIKQSGETRCEQAVSLEQTNGDFLGVLTTVCTQDIGTTNAVNNSNKQRKPTIHLNRVNANRSWLAIESMC